MTRARDRRPPRALRRTRQRPIAVARAFGLALLLAAACNQTVITPPPVTGQLPPLPPTPGRSLGANEPPLAYVGGTLTDVAEGHLEVTEPGGQVVTVQRLAQSATSFWRVSGSQWVRLAGGVPIGAGQAACLETLIAGSNLLAIRVFLGATCGPR